MSTPGSPEQNVSHRKTVSRWIAYPLGIFVWEILPWLISLLMPRYGWTAGQPGAWNLLGLIPVFVGTAGFIGGMKRHSAASPPAGFDWELEKDYFLQDGLYAFSRNPMYLSELTLLFGWVIFYGSIALLIVWILALLAFNFYAIPQEERAMEARHGGAYRAYARRVRRWFGKVS
jgi:protein-S-isoprenylcysteine O-methyltransferase Ste14